MSWENVESYLFCLFPALRKQWNSELRTLYRQYLERLPKDALYQAIDRHAAESHFCPRPGVIANTAKTLIPPDLNTKRERDDLEASRKQAQKSWDEAVQSMKWVGKEACLIHKKTVLASDWRLQHLADKPVMSKSWIAIISKRIDRDLSPDEIDPEIPPCPLAKSNALKDSLSLDQVT